MDEKGVYGVARSIWDCDAFMKQKFTQREAWLWLVGAAVWKQASVNLDGRRVTLERGEFAFSLRFLAKKWKWSKDGVSRFFLLLKNEDMIRDTARDGVKVYLIAKYNEFQVVGLPKRDTNCDAERDTRETAARQPCDKEETLQTLETKEEERAAPKGAALRVVHSKPLPDWLDREAWGAFLEMRKRKRSPVTPRAAELLLGKLERWRAKGHDPTAILDASTAGAWTGLYEPKDEKTNGKQSPHITLYEVSRDICADILASGEGSEGGGADQAPFALLPARSNGGTN